MCGVSKMVRNHLTSKGSIALRAGRANAPLLRALYTLRCIFMLESDITKSAILDREEIVRIIDSQTVEDIDLAISNLLHDEDIEKYLCATRFFRDLINYGIKNGVGAVIHKSYSSLNFFKIVESNLFSSSTVKRSDSAYTLGKVCSVASISKLEQSIEKFRAIDPEYADGAQFELDWLKAQSECVNIICGS